MISLRPCREVFEYAWGVPRPAILACAVASVLAARLWLSAGLFLLVAWTWIWWLWLRPLGLRWVQWWRRSGALRLALLPGAVAMAVWLALLAAASTDAGSRVIRSWLPAAHVERLDRAAEARERTLESIREGLRRSARKAREAREGANE